MSSTEVCYVITMALFLLLAGVLWKFSCRKEKYAFRLIAYIIIDAIGLACIVKYTPKLMTIENRFYSIIAGFLNRDVTAVESIFEKAAETVDLSGYLISFFSIGAIIFNVIDLRKIGTKNPYPISERKYFRTLALIQLIVMELAIILQIVGCIFLQSLCLLIMIFTTICFVFYYVQNHRARYSQRIMSSELKKKLGENPIKLETDLCWRSIALPMSRFQHFDPYSQVMNEVSMWSRIILSGESIADEGVEGQIIHLLGAIHIFLSENREDSEMHSGVLPFVLGYASISDQSIYSRQKFCAMLRCVRKKFEQDIKIGASFIEGMCVARIHRDFMTALIEHEGNEDNAMKSSFYNLFYDCTRNLGQDEEGNLGRGLFKYSMRVWSAICYLYGAWKESKKNDPDEVAKEITNSFYEVTNRIDEKYDSLSNKGRFAHEMEDTGLALQSFNLLLAGGWDEACTEQREQIINQCFLRIQQKTVNNNSSLAKASSGHPKRRSQRKVNKR